MIRVNCRTLLLVLLAFAASPPGRAAAGTITGVVRNGTTGKVVAGQEVLLIQLQGGMETVASTKTDAQGRYTLDHPSLGQAPMLVRVNYRDVNFHQSVPPGRSVADVEVYESTADPRAFEIESRAILVQPSGPMLLIGEEYAIRNRSDPPVAYFKADGTFEFEIPDGAEMGQVAAWGPSGMPVGQGTIEKGKNRYAIAFPFRPGENGARLAYQVPYRANRITLRVPSPYAVKQVSLVAPPGLEVQAEGFRFSGTDQGWNVYARESPGVAAPFDVTISGTAAPPSSASEPGAGSNAPDSGAPDSGAPARAADSLFQYPGRLDSLKWPLIGGFSALFALGAIFLWLKSRSEPESAEPGVAASPERPAAKAAKVASAAAEVPAGAGEVSGSLEEIKETLFRLELRHQAGTISEEEYARERGRAEKILREFLKG